MQVVLFICVFVYAVVGQDINDMINMPKYDQRYDYLDVDAIFTNKRLIRNYVDCLISAKRCSPEGKALKRILPEALRTKCIRCTEHQKRTAVKLIKRLKHEFPEEWSKLASRWDPTGDFTRYFEEYLAKEHYNSIPRSDIEHSAPTPSPPSLPPLPPVPPTVDNEPPTTSEDSPPRPIILNRFGDDGEMMMGSGSSASMSPKPMAQTTTKPTTTMRPPFYPRPVPPSPTSTAWINPTTNSQTTRYTMNPVSDLPEPYSTTITLIDQIGFKIIRTTELFTDLLKNTVRAVVGR